MAFHEGAEHLLHWNRVQYTGMDHCWHVVFTSDQGARLKCCFCDKYAPIKDCENERDKHGVFAPHRIFVQPPREDCPKR